ncbi:MAG: bifunctional (p)ppGpp synthetase/guanosine-3',5'-bis(diphosphate) 3'-pyrophosphohydrolase [Hyphomicrobiales bacterium]|nr:bifunctional (p)ppGpp synthetase/guanosine-3',5'-bis(diphosphate) 3'-pyrophosphohydrolase [Hyphomicrobiales bacterium]MBV9589279.1 bifunctional (p)ppGpp synthetase/guanosine-3',5'-bis(diphosphate) 3'-pyrophosphohydrolase [Hyphomicrobiales bacterium]MBV9977158.1 bifunctional (p)ppGpp synthetase/guanosine-3',5'-bis(diphosphate) 3'-pyrophosphohydrolase [Hyphomicrobiales bacterium]
MMRQYELVDRVKRYNPDADEALLNRAYVYAMKAHGAQKRASGDPYFSHPLEVAAILTDLHLDDSTIVAAMLHDTIEDTATTREEIDQLFGHEIATLVEGLTKLKRLDLVSKRAAQAENLRKLLLAIAEDVRVLLVKLADRLHNMRTLHFVPADKRGRVAQETLDIYAPLAGRMGMQDMRDEFEELAFKELMPEAHDTIVRRLSDISGRSEALIQEIEGALARSMEAQGLAANVKGRLKKPYSVWRKMNAKSIALEQLSDIFGFRVIVRNTAECYRALGVVHTSWPMVPGRFKDYISVPKQNDYRSLHTTIVGPARQRVELQIRTAEMHKIAELGIAAHALYKDGLSPDKRRLAAESSAFAWLRRTIANLAEGDPEEFLENTKLELFHDQVFCFTPKGRLIALPRGATPIDFAYAVHTELGNGMVGCKINGRLAPLVSELRNGDEVEVLSTESQAPPAAWESLVVTGKARAAIRRATRIAVRRQYGGLGRQLVQRAFQRAGRAYSDDNLKAALPRLARGSVEDVLAAVGRGEMASSDVLRALYPDYHGERAHVVSEPAPKDPGWFTFPKSLGLIFKPASSSGKAQPMSDVPVIGLDADLPVRFAEGGAVPGDRIVGILTPGEGVTVHRIDSPELARFENALDQWFDVRWDVDGKNARRFPARIVVVSINEPGSLAQVAAVVAEHDGNIENITMTRRTDDFVEMTIDISVWDLKHLTAILAQLRSKPVVNSAERAPG